MKTIGIIGGLSWLSTATYYQKINQLVNQQLGDVHAAKILLYSVDFYDFKTLADKNDWDKIEILITDIALKLQNAGANCILIATNSVHLIADKVKQKINIPLLHIAEETAKEVVKEKIKKVGLIGTKFVMENDFFKDRLKNFGIESVVPDTLDRDFIHKTIFSELTIGIFKEETKQQFLKIIDALKNNGATGVIFGCTEFALLLKPEDCSIKVFDTTEIHCKAVVEFAL